MDFVLDLERPLTELQNAICSVISPERGASLAERDALPPSSDRAGDKPSPTK